MERGDLTGAILDGRYRVIEPVAEGAMGVVYRAERVKLGRIVAIKVLHDVLPNELSGRKRFEIEAMAMAKLEHPHCASVLDVGVHNDRPFVVMDFVSGQNLRDVIAGGPQPIPRATEIVRQVLSGLAHAHELGIIHRDIKPANIVLSHKTGLGDHVKILDFGLARLHDTGQNLTSGIVVGTPAYMAPEQIRGERLDHRADLYACGVLLFELLTGQKPFHSQNDDPIEVCRMHLSAAVPRLSAKLAGTDFGELEAVVARALAKRSEDRHASAQDFAAAIDAVVPRRASIQSLQSLTPIPRSGPIPLASAPMDASYPPAVEVRTADVLSAVPADAPAAPAARDAAAARDASAARDAAAARDASAARDAAAARDASAARDAGDAEDAEIGAAASARRPARPIQTESPGTFLGLAVAPTVRLASPEARETASAPVRKPRRRWWLAALAGVALVGGGGAALALWPEERAAAPAGAEPGAEKPDPGREIAARASELAAEGGREAALDLIARARRQYPESAMLPYTAGRIFFSKLYWTDGLKGFRDAIRIDPRYRSHPELIKTVLRGFITTPGYNDELAAFLRDDIGSPAQPFLEETARDHPNPSIRSRAANELRRYRAR